jgi:hypothetical protein
MSAETPRVQFEVTEDLDEEITLEEEYKAKQEKIIELWQKIKEALTDDLKESGKTEHKADVPVLYQEYGTDCAIALARMALAYYGVGDMGTDSFVREAVEMGANIPYVVDAKDQKGPQGNPTAIMSVLAKHGVVMGQAGFPADEGFVSSIKKGEPIYLSIRFHTLHPEDQTTMDRSHAVLATGYRLNERGELVILVNDPKPGIGGAKELTKEQFSEALEYLPLTVFRKREPS